MSASENIRSARTINADFYCDENLHAAVREKIFAASWQFVLDQSSLKAPGHAIPLTILDGFLNEPVLLTRTNERLHCLSNVCTHRGNLLVEDECEAQTLRCRYHGRRFALDGSFISAPGFEDAIDFPSQDDSLPSVPLGQWKTMLFVNPSPKNQLFQFDELISEMDRRVGWLPLSEFIFDPTTSKDYIVQANWALYCENYLEGLHIPYVHPELAAAIDTQDYCTEIFNYSNLQIGIASSAEHCFDLPKNSPDYGRKIGAYYFWLFPNMMFNFYPWGLSINIVKPISHEQTKVVFLSYIWDAAKVAYDVDKVELEDEAIIENVQKGVKSRFYHRGRYAPGWEAGTYHFHQLLRSFMPEID